MKKLLLPFFLLSFLFCFTSCDSDDKEKEEIVISFEGRLTNAEDEFTTTDGTPVDAEDPDTSYFTTFKDSQGFLTFDSYYASWGFAGGFTYTNKTDVTTPGFGNISAITGKGKNGQVYFTVNQSSFSPAKVTINNPSLYEFKGAWFTNTTYAYLSIKEGDSFAKKFTDGDWFKLTVIGYNSSNSKTGSVDIYLADFRDGKSEILSEWTWVDLSSLGSATYLGFELASTDNGDWGMFTPSYFCMDAITLIEK